MEIHADSESSTVHDHEMDIHKAAINEKDRWTLMYIAPQRTQSLTEAIDLSTFLSVLEINAFTDHMMRLRAWV